MKISSSERRGKVGGSYINGLKSPVPPKREKHSKKTFFVVVAVMVLLIASFVVLTYKPIGVASNGFVLGAAVPYEKSYSPDLIKNAKFLGYMNENQKITVILSFKWRNSSELDEFLNEVNDPKSPNYMHFMTWDEFRDKHAPPADVYNAMVEWVKAKGLKIQHTWPLRNAISIRDTIGNIEKAFNTKFGAYEGDGIHYKKYFYAATRPLELPENVIPYMLDVEGTNNARIIKTRIASQKFAWNSFSTRFANNTGDTVRYVTTGDMLRMYHIWQLINNSADPTQPVNKPILAKGLRAVTILWEGSTSQWGGSEASPFDPANVYYAWKHTIPTWIQNAGGMPHVWGHGVESDCVPPGTDNDATGANIETELDLEMVGGLAPGIDVVEVYSDSQQNGFPKDNYDYVLNTLAHNSTLTIVSNSWGYTGSEGSMDSGTMADVQALNALGVTNLASSGDDGDASYPSAPSSATYNNYGFLAIGGTTPVPNGVPGAKGDEALMGNNTDVNNPRSDEYLWYDYSSTISGSSDHYGTQSGTSSNYPYTWWQQNYGGIGSTSGRNTADIAASGNRTLVYTWSSNNGNGWYILSGTSVASPVIGGMFSEMAAYIGRYYDGMGQSTAQTTIHGFGFFAPTIYHLADDYYNHGKYSSSPPFFDVTENDPHSHPYGSHPVGQGWDFPTGWGVPNAWEFIHDIGPYMSSVQSSQTINAGDSTQFTVKIWFPYNWTSEMGHFEVLGLPSGASFTTDVSYVNPAGNGAVAWVNFTITTSSTTPAGTYSLTIVAYTYNHTSGHWGNLSASTPVTLVVNSAVPEFSSMQVLPVLILFGAIAVWSRRRERKK